MNAAGKAWIVAASIGAVEALKDQGICRWNYTMRSMIKHAQNKVRFYSQFKMLSSSTSTSTSSSSTTTASSVASGANEMRNSVTKKREECVKKVMDLSCWGPSTIRF